MAAPFCFLKKLLKAEKLLTPYKREKTLGTVMLCVPTPFSERSFYRLLQANCEQRKRNACASHTACSHAFCE